MTYLTGEQDALTYLYGFNGTEVEKDGVLYLFYSDRHRYSRGERIQMTFVKVNTLGFNTVFTYRNTQYYDFGVKYGSAPLWRWSEGKYFLQIIQQKIFTPGEMQTIQESWLIPDDAPAGFYTLEGEDKSMNGTKLQIVVEVAQAGRG